MLVSLGESAMLVGTVPGGRSYYHPKYPRCNFIVRDRPGALVTVLDRETLRGALSESTSPHQEQASMAGASGWSEAGSLSRFVATTWGDADAASEREQTERRAVILQRVFLELGEQQSRVWRDARRLADADGVRGQRKERVLALDLRENTPFREPRCSGDVLHWIQRWYGIRDTNNKDRGILLRSLLTKSEELVPCAVSVQVHRARSGHFLVFVRLQPSNPWLLDLIVPPDPRF